VGAPWVSNDPVLSSLLNSKSNNWDFVHNVNVSSRVMEDARCVVLKGSRNCNTTSDRPSLVNFLDHCIFSCYVCILINSVSVILIRDEAWFVRITVFAGINWRAYFSVVVTSGSVNGASLISNVWVVDEFEGTHCSSSVAPIISHVARDDYLRGDVDIRPCGISHDLYSIGHSWSSSLGPAWTTILGDVLVLNVSQIVCSVNSIPDEGLWYVLHSGQSFLNNRNFITSSLFTARVNRVHILKSGLFLRVGQSWSSN